jgi:membrane protease YdiL (CAAX protease family)
MKIKKDLTVFIMYLLFISFAEVVTSIVDPIYGIIIHTLLLFSLIALSVFRPKNASNVFLCLSIAPLIRIFSLSLPLSYFPDYTWYIIAGIPMLIAAISLMRIQGLKLSDVGINRKKPVLQFLIMLTGIPFGVLEYLILKPDPITTGLTIIDFIFLAVAFILATGFVEELVFRGVFQNNAVKLFGAKTGLIAVSAVFAVLHIGWFNLLDVFLVFFIGLFFGVLMFKTGSLVGVSLSHGLTNVFLFLVLPSVNLINTLAPK